MSEELDDLLGQINRAKRGRLEADIPPSDNYWKLVNRYRQTLSESGGVHIPEAARTHEQTREIFFERQVLDANGLLVGVKGASNLKELTDEEIIAANNRRKAIESLPKRPKTQEEFDAEEEARKLEEAQVTETERLRLEEARLEQERLTRNNSIQTENQENQVGRSAEEQLRSLGL